MRLSEKNAPAIQPLVDIYTQFGAKTFLNIAEILYSMRLTGKLISWAYLFCKSDPKTFVEKITERDSQLIEYVNTEADFFECFRENGKVGRAIVTKNNSKVHKFSFLQIFLAILVSIVICERACKYF